MFAILIIFDVSRWIGISFGRIIFGRQVSGIFPVFIDRGGIPDRRPAGPVDAGRILAVADRFMGIVPTRGDA